MKAKDLIERLNKLIQLKPDANVYFYVDDETESLSEREC